MLEDDYLEKERQVRQRALDAVEEIKKRREAISRQRNFESKTKYW